MANYNEIFQRQKTPAIICNNSCQVTELNQAAVRMLDIKKGLTTMPGWQLLGFEGDHDCDRCPLSTGEPEGTLHLIRGGKNFEIATTKIGDSVLHEIKDVTEAYTDPLTKLGNRRYLIKSLQAEIERSKRQKKPLTGIMFDIDGFKQINDDYGHKAGDIVLKEISGLLLATLRKVDVVGRYGGDEIVILLPETTIEAGASVAERIRKLVEDYTFYKQTNIKITISLGVAAINADDNHIEQEDLEKALIRQDQALYMAKNNGRNKVYIRKDDENGNPVFMQAPRLSL